VEKNIITGIILFRHRTKNGELDGEVITRNSQGILTDLDHYKEGHFIDTSRSWDSGGKLRTQIICTHSGDYCTTSGFDKTGKLSSLSHSRYEVETDTFFAWYENGRIKKQIIYGAHGDKDFVTRKWSPSGVLIDSFVQKNGQIVVRTLRYENGQPELHRERKWIDSTHTIVWNGESWDSTGKVTGTVREGNGILMEQTPNGHFALQHFIEGQDQNALSPEQMLAGLTGQKVSAYRFDRYPDSTVRCMYVDMGGDIGMLYAVCYTPDGKKTGEVLKGEGTLMVPHLDGKGSETRVFRKGKEVLH
jgi:antitoxin component YwqK of YwqJK toxin-antitoxin module